MTRVLLQIFAESEGEFINFLIDRCHSTYPHNFIKNHQLLSEKCSTDENRVVRRMRNNIFVYEFVYEVYEFTFGFSKNLQ